MSMLLSGIAACEAVVIDRAKRLDRYVIGRLAESQAVWLRGIGIRHGVFQSALDEELLQVGRRFANSRA
jgi:hypothetical protein